MLNTNISEHNFEECIEAVLLSGGPDAVLAAEQDFKPLQRAPGPFVPGGYYKREQTHYDRALCLDKDLLYQFILATQIEAWQKVEQMNGNQETNKQDARVRLFQTVDSDIRKHGLIYVLRNGIKISGNSFKLAYFPPSSNLNQAHALLYRANRFSLIRQLRYGERNAKSLDLVLFLNGIPILTAELKNPLNGQNVEQAIRQYQLDRDPKGEPLLTPRRCLVHFAVDTDLVYMSAHLEGKSTRFLPFNRGKDGGAGNWPLHGNFATAYLWEQVWATDSLLNLIQNFVIEEQKEDAKTRKVERRVLFPRYHQMDVVRRLVTDARANGPGRRYLIQHSAGSGKSNSIAWLAHQLSVLHNEQDQRVFNTVFIITDRVNLDRQLQETVTQFERTRGVVAHADSSADLRKHLDAGRDIIVTTLWKFPLLADAIAEREGRRFAIIIDEAHSSQSGDAAQSVSKVLRARSLEAAEEAEAKAEENARTFEDLLIEEQEKRGLVPNASYFAFTATPKPRTRQLFGQKRPDGGYEAFHSYTMRQAIDENFILDVLKNFRTYADYWQLYKTIEEDPTFDKSKATRLLRVFVNQHPRLIEEKVAVMMAHFDAETRDAIAGRARAMIVTASRLHAVRYKQAVDKWIADNGVPYRALVAFSGEVEDGGVKYTEPQMNGGVPEKQTAATLATDPNRILIVANKYQTGFDEPLLHTMYVDKKLSGVAAVQTLSRLNRVLPPHKTEVMVLDFANQADDIQKAFQVFYDRAVLTEGADPKLLYHYQTELRKFGLYDDATLDAIAAADIAIRDKKPGAHQATLHSLLDEVVQQFKALDDDARNNFARLLKDYVRLYGFLAQLLDFADAGLEKLYRFARLLQHKLPIIRETLPLEVTESADLEFVRVTPTGNHSITLTPSVQEVEPQHIEKQGSRKGGKQEEPLSRILKEINDRFGIPPDQAGPFVQHLEEKLNADDCLRAAFDSNPSPSERLLVFRRRVRDQIQDMLDVNFEMYKQVNDNPEFADQFTQWLCERYQQNVEN